MVSPAASCRVLHLAATPEDFHNAVTASHENPADLTWILGLFPPPQFLEIPPNAEWVCAPWGEESSPKVSWRDFFDLIVDLFKPERTFVHPGFTKQVGEQCESVLARVPEPVILLIEDVAEIEGSP